MKFVPMIFPFLFLLFSGCNSISSSTASSITKLPSTDIVKTKTFSTNLLPTHTYTHIPEPTTTFTPLSITRQPTSAYKGWLVLNYDDYTFLYPSSYYHPEPDPVHPCIIIADTKDAVEAYMNTERVPRNHLLLSIISFGNSLKMDPYDETSPLVSPELALQKIINRTIGIPYDVDPSTVVPWENENGESGGRKVYYPNIPYQNILLGVTMAAKVSTVKGIYYFILNPHDYSYYLRVFVQPIDSTLMNIGDQILSTFAFTN